MTAQDSDKGIGRHNYTTIYFALFGNLSEKSGRLFEMGIGTNDPTLPSTMGAEGTPGASLRGWRDFFPGWGIYGADIDHRILFQEARIATFYCDQCSAESISELWQDGKLQGSFDIMIDDGLHTLEANSSCFEGSIHKLSDDGFYVIEDVHLSELDAWRKKLAGEYRANYPAVDFYLVEIPSLHNHTDNNLVIGHRRAVGVS